MPTAALTLHTFIAKWRSSSLKERSSSKSHFIDLRALLGQPTLTNLDSDATWFTFEKGASKRGGGEGWPSGLGDESALARLFALNFERKGR